jgi:hypothetical protein
MIDAEATLWVAVCAASFVRQYSDEHARTADPPLDKCDGYMEEACAVADTAIESYRRVFKP